MREARVGQAVMPTSSRVIGSERHNSGITVQERASRASAAFNPWHFNNRSKPQHRLPCDMQLGAVAMAGVVDRLQQIGSYVIGRSEARAESE